MKKYLGGLNIGTMTFRIFLSYMVKNFFFLMGEWEIPPISMEELCQ